LASFVLLLSASPLWAVNHVTPGSYPNHKKDMIHVPTAAQIQHFGSLRGALVGTATGTINVAVIVVQFPNSSCGGCTSGFHSIQNMPTIYSNFTQMSTYYNEVSYG